MKIKLDNSPNQLAIKENNFDFAFWQLQTPLCRRKLVPPYGLDDGSTSFCSTRFRSTV